MKIYIETQRLILRTWQEEDIPHLARLNSDEKVMEYFLKPLSYQETVDLYSKIQSELTTYGYGVYAVKEKETGAFVGFVGLHNVTFEVDFAPAVEILWRILPEFWGKGYASEAAKACLNYAQNELNLKEIVAFTSLPNTRSEHVMQRIGMKHVKEFNHPLVEPNHPLLRHVLYKIDLTTLCK